MNLAYRWKNYWVVPLLVVGVFVASAFLFMSVAIAAVADEAEHQAQVQAAIEDLSSATGQDITSEDQAKDLCNQEQYLDVCADIGKKHELYTEEEIKHVDDFLSAVKGQVLEDIKSCADEECLIRVATDLASKIQKSNPTLATSLKLTTTIVAEKKTVVEAAKEIGINFTDCESMDPDTAPIDLLRKCAKLAKDSRVQKYIPEERRVLAEQFEDSSTLKLREALTAGKYQCGDGTLEGCGNYCLNPDAATKAAGIPAVCTQIAKEIFGQEGVKQLESARQHVGQVKDYYSKKFILTLPSGRELVGEGQIRNACDQAFSGRNLETARACGSFAVNNGFATQAEVDKGLKLMELFIQKGQNANFDQCLTNPTACREFIPEDDRERFDAGSQIFEIMRTEIGFDPSQCERGSVDQAIGTKCFEGSKRALAKIEGLGLANQSREARFIIEDVKRHVTEGESFISKKDEFKQVFSQQGGPGGCKSEVECFTYCSNPTNGPECIAFGSKQGISGFRGQEAVQKFEEYNYNLQRPGLVSDEYKPFSSGGQYPQYPGQGPYPGFQPPGQGGFPPGQDPRFTQPGPGYSPPPGVGGYYPGPGPVGPSPECFAAIQSGDFAKAKTACSSSGPSLPFPTGQVCPATPYVECPAGQYHESYRNPDGCWIDGPCKSAPTYSPGPYPTYTYSPYPIYTPGPSCPAGQWWDYTYKTCTSATPPPSCPSGQWWDYTQNKCSSTASPYPTYSPPGDPALDCQRSGGVWDSVTKYCKFPSPTYSPYPTYTPGPSCPAGQWWDYQMNQCSSTVSPYPTYSPHPSGVKPDCSDGKDNDNDGKTDYPADSSCYGPDDWDEYYPILGTSPSPSPTSCPAGYHYHLESGGFCLNDQENYSGACYDSIGTSKITCPAQPSYTPPPSCPSGQWWDTAKQACTSSPTQCPAGYYWDSAANMCKPSSGTYSPPPSCPSGQWWDSASSSCKSSTPTYTPYPTATTYTPPPSCPSGQWWDSVSSSCKSSTSTYTPYPTSTYTYTPPPTCSSTQYWNGTSCVDNVTTTPTPYPTIMYTSTPHPTTTTEMHSCPSGQYWNGSACVSSTSSLPNQYMVAHCQQLGRTWNGKVCQANGLFARFYENNVANVLRAFYIVP